MFNGFEHSFFLPLRRLRGCVVYVPGSGPNSIDGFKLWGNERNVYVDPTDDNRAYVWYKKQVWRVKKSFLVLHADEEGEELEDCYYTVAPLDLTNRKEVA